MDRRQFVRLGAATVAVPGASFGRLSEAFPWPHPTPDSSAAGVGICDWNLLRASDPEQIPLAARAGVQGIQVSVGTRPDHVPLREPAVRSRYLELGRVNGILFPSVAAGSLLNRIPLKSEPQSAIYVVDALEAARALGSSCILIAFFGDGDLRLRGASGERRNLTPDEPFARYELDTRGVGRVVEALRQIVPRAEDAGVVLGLENTLTAEQNLDILDQVGSTFVQVYYDVGNSTAYGYDVPSEINLLGSDRICEIHIKETLSLDDPMAPRLGAPEDGGVDFIGVSEALRSISYAGWYILETSGRDSRFEEDTRLNVEFVRSELG